jgi:PIN domain nuclease of toxin-antitoxin system
VQCANTNTAMTSDNAYVVDASGLLRYLDREPGFDRVAELLKQAARSEVRLLVSAVNWGEVVSVLYRAHGLSVTRVTLHKLRALPLAVLAADGDQAELAGIFKQDFKVPYADAFAGSLALREKATLVTADFDFKSAARTIKVEFLSDKKSKTKP